MEIKTTNYILYKEEKDWKRGEEEREFELNIKISGYRKKEKISIKYR